MSNQQQRLADIGREEHYAITAAASAARILAEADPAAGEEAEGAMLAEVKRDLEFVHSQLAKLNTSIIALQTHSLRQTGGVALSLSVLIAIAWNVIGG
jgi:hypothetical protein